MIYFTFFFSLFLVLMFSIKCIFYTGNTAWCGLGIFHILNSYRRLVISVLDRVSLDGIENVGDLYTNNDCCVLISDHEEYLGRSNFQPSNIPAKQRKVSKISLSQFLWNMHVVGLCSLLLKLPACFIKSSCISQSLNQESRSESKGKVLIVRIQGLPCYYWKCGMLQSEHCL